jgi:hypothetical protein
MLDKAADPSNVFCNVEIDSYTTILNLEGQIQKQMNLNKRINKAAYIKSTGH